MFSPSKKKSLQKFQERGTFYMFPRYSTMFGELTKQQPGAYALKFHTAGVNTNILYVT